MDATANPAVHPVPGTAGDIMSAPPITVLPTATRAHIVDTLTKHRISAVPVVDEGGRVVGLVSEHDLLANDGADATALMTTAVVSVSVDSPLEDVRHLLVDRRILRVPVMRHGELVGVVSRGDLVATMATEWVCEVCGESVRGESPPDACPKCRSGPGNFVHQEQPPGA